MLEVQTQFLESVACSFSCCFKDRHRKKLPCFLLLKDNANYIASHSCGGFIKWRMHNSVQVEDSSLKIRSCSSNKCGTSSCSEISSAQRKTWCARIHMDHIEVLSFQYRSFWVGLKRWRLIPGVCYNAIPSVWRLKTELFPRFPRENVTCKDQMGKNTFHMDGWATKTIHWQ